MLCVLLWCLKAWAVSVLGFAGLVLWVWIGGRRERKVEAQRQLLAGVSARRKTDAGYRP